MEVVLNVGTCSHPGGILMENHQIDNCNSLRELTPCSDSETLEFSIIKEGRCAGSQCSNETDAENEDRVSAGHSVLQTDGKSRMLMRHWLQCNADKGDVPGLRWLDKKKGLISIAWKHGSKSNWSPHDGEVFESWAKYTGRYNPAKDLARKWKANFRCAINSLPDVVFVPEKSSKTGNNPCQVYQLLDEKPRRRGHQRRSSLSQVDRFSQHRVCQPDTTTDADAITLMSTMSKQTRNQCGIKRKSKTNGELTSEPEDTQSPEDNSNSKVLIPTTVLELCSDDEEAMTLHAVSSDQVEEVVCETQLERTITIDDQTLLLAFDQTSKMEAYSTFSIDLGFEDVELQENEWPTDLDKIICTF